MKIINIKQYHQLFYFSVSSPGTVVCKEYSDSPGVPIKMLKESSWAPSVTDVPPIIQPYNSDIRTIVRQAMVPIRKDSAILC